MAGRLLIAGIGNIFFRDDAFGVEVARRLLERPQPAGVEVVDFGIRGFDLAYALLDDYEAAILIDATPRGGEPGTIYLIEPDEDTTLGLEPAGAGLETHSIDPVSVLSLVKALGGQLPRLSIVGCEPAAVGYAHDGEMGLSAPVAAGVDGAVRLVESLVAGLLAEWVPAEDARQ